MILHRQDNISSFLYHNLLSPLKLQLDLPDIDGIYNLLDSPNQFSVKQIESFRKLISESLFMNKSLLEEFLTLLDTLVVIIALEADPITVDLSQISCEKLSRLQTRQDFDVQSTLSALESSIIYAIGLTTTLEALKPWHNPISELKSKFNIGDTSLKPWFELKLIQTIISELETNKKNEICNIIQYIQQMIGFNFSLLDIKSIAIDSAFYYISELEESKSYGDISEILGIINTCGVVPSMENKFQKYITQYGIKNIFVKVQKNQDESLAKKDIVDLENIYRRDVTTRKDDYKVVVNKGVFVQNNEKVAVKSYITMNFDIITQFKQEIEIMKLLSGLNGPFLKYYGYYLETYFDEDLQTDLYELGIVMEYCPKTLADKIKTKRIASSNKNSNPNARHFNESELESIAGTLIGGFALMSEIKPKIYHRDIKPDNIYFSATGNLENVKIGDFNISTIENIFEITHTTGFNEIKGTLAYMAPEIQLSLTQGRGRFRKGKADVYSLGITLLQMITLDPNTYNGPALRSKLNQKIEQVPYDWLKVIIKLSLCENYRQRPSFKDLLQYVPTRTIVQ